MKKTNNESKILRRYNKNEIQLDSYIVKIVAKLQ